MKRTFLAAFLLVAAAPFAYTATYVVTPDDELIEQAEAIVIGRPVRSEARPTRGIRTYSSIQVIEVLKGGEPFAPGHEFEVVSPGGVVGSQALIVPGSPRYRPNEKVMIFLVRNDAGEWTTLHMALGKFRSVVRAGRERLVRGEDDEPIHGMTPDGRPYEERERDENRFKDYIKGRARGERPPKDYEENRGGANRIREPEVEVASLNPISILPQISSAYPASAYMMTLGSPARPARWKVWDSGTSAISYRSSGSQAGQPDSLGSFTRALAAWTNDPNSSIRLTYGGTTSATSGMRSDGIHSIIFNDPSNEIAGSWTGSGVIATGRFWANLSTHTHRGETFYSITEGDVIVQNGVTLSAIKFDEALTHEVGHTLAFRHSNDARQPSTSSAVMNSSVRGTYGTNLQSWDRSAAAMAYGTGSSSPPACQAPAITSQPRSTSVARSSTTTLSVVATGTGLTYQWYRGASGTTTSPVANATSATFITPAVTGTTSYWVRVNGTCGTVSSAAATVSVASSSSCTPPSITTQPASRTIASGTSTTLTVGVSGTGPFTYQWYRGTTMVATTASYTTPNLIGTKYYKVIVTNSCGTVTSQTATVTVR